MNKKKILVYSNQRIKPKLTNHLQFHPGQWLDTYLPTLPKAGGFTITSPPHLAKPQNQQANSPTNSPKPGYLELAIQRTPNPPAQYLHRPIPNLLHTPLRVRVGGSFTWPPPALPTPQIKRLVLIAGGVGINPLISILAHLIRGPGVERPREIHVLYGTKAPEGNGVAGEVLFLPRLVRLVGEAGEGVTGRVFLTGGNGSGDGGEGIVREGFPEGTWGRRMERGDLLGALDGWGSGSAGREETVCFVCGPQGMTDEIVEFLKAQEGMQRERVLCEKWW